MSRRGERLEELVHALRVCWAADPVEFEGEFFSIPPSTLASDAGRAGPGAGSEPLSLWLRTFVQHPNAERPRSFDEVIAEVHEAAATGMRHVIIDANFADAVSGTGGWLDMVERLAPAARV